MNENENWLRERISSNPDLDKNERWFIELLANESAHENDVSGAIDTLEMLLSLDALMPLLSLVRDSNRSVSLKKQAAKAISVIGSSYLETDLKKMLNAYSPELRLLAQIALTGC